MFTRCRVAAAVAVAGVLCAAGPASAQGRPGGMGMHGGMRGGGGTGMQGGAGGGQCRGQQQTTGQQGQRSMTGMNQSQNPNLYAARQQIPQTQYPNQLASPGTAASTSQFQQQAYRDQQWQQYVRAVGMHPTNQRWLQQGSYR